MTATLRDHLTSRKEILLLSAFGRANCADACNISVAPSFRNCSVPDDVQSNSDAGNTL